MTRSDRLTLIEKAFIHLGQCRLGWLVLRRFDPHGLSSRHLMARRQFIEMNPALIEEMIAAENRGD
jgi:hypothetical protein